MKKITLFFAAAAIIGIGSAVATTSQGIGDEYVKIGSTYQLRSLYPNGECEPTSSDPCTYTKTANNGSLPDQNPANFVVDQTGDFVNP